MRLQKTIRKLTTVAFSVLVGLGSGISPAMAEETTAYTYRSSEKGAITIHYFDDSDMTMPVKDSTWAIVKVADILTDVDDERTDGLYIKSYIDGFDITRKTTAEISDESSATNILSNFKYTKVTESELKFSGELKDGTKLETQTGTTDANGELTFSGLSEGVYLGVELESARYHLLSDPFLISIPYTDEGIVKDTGDILSSHLVADIDPKPYLAGDLTIEKDLPSGSTLVDETFTFTITLPVGKYRAEMPDGSPTILNITNTSGNSTGQIIQRFRANQTMTIYGLPVGEKYNVVESEENSMDYTTKYVDCFGAITAKSAKKAVVENYLNNGGVDTLAYNADPESDDYGYNVIYPAEKAMVEDKVTYLHLKPETKYTIKGEIHLLDANGNDTGTIAAHTEKQFTTCKANGKSTAGDTAMGYVTQSFSFDASDYDSSTLVIYEYIYDGSTKLVQHCDPSDTDQQITVSKNSTYRQRRVKKTGVSAGGMIAGGLGIAAAIVLILIVIKRRRNEKGQGVDGNE